MKGLELLPLDAGCAVLLAELHAASFDDSWDAGAIAKLLALPGAFGWVAARDGKPVGFALARAAAGEAEILTLGVLAECRRAGIGRRLSAAVLERVRADGGQRVVLEVAADNLAALALYRGLGFSSVGVRPDYYLRRDGSRADARLMSIDFPS